MDRQFSPDILPEDRQAGDTFKHLVDCSLVILNQFPLNVHVKSIFVGFSDHRHRLDLGQVDLVFGKGVQDPRQGSVEMADFEADGSFVDPFRRIPMLGEYQEAGIVLPVGLNSRIENLQAIHFRRPEVSNGCRAGRLFRDNKTGRCRRVAELMQFRLGKLFLQILGTLLQCNRMGIDIGNIHLFHPLTGHQVHLDVDIDFPDNFQVKITDQLVIVKDAVGLIRDKVVSVEDDIIKFNIKELNQLSNPRGYLYNLLKEYNFTEWEDVTNLLSAQSGKQVYSATHRLLKDRDFLLLKEIQPENFSKITINIEALYEQSLHGNLSFEEVENMSERDECIIYVDRDKLQFPLELRTWKEADFYYPFGMEGKKKLSKYFKDEKLSLIDKEHIRLLCSGEDIVWIIGKRADDRFKVTDKTKQILKITHNSLC